MDMDLSALRPINGDRLDAVLEAVADLDTEDESMNDAGQKLSSLSSYTKIDQIDASPDGVFSPVDRPNDFEAVATIYVDLTYGSQGDSSTISDSYPATVRGHFQQGKAVVDSVDVDTSSFYR